MDYLDSKWEPYKMPGHEFYKKEFPVYDEFEKMETSPEQFKNLKNLSYREILEDLEEKIIFRRELNSRDGNTAETYDQFYRDHKLLLVLFRALAVMPILRSSPGRITFKWTSTATIYAIFFWTFMTGVVLFIGHYRLKVLESVKGFDDYIYSVIFLIFLIPHFWIPFVGWGVAREVAVYKTMWGAFQVRFYRVTATTLVFPNLKVLIIIISIGCLLCAILFLGSLSFLLEGFPLWNTLAYFHIITMINMNCALWYINSRAIKRAAISLSECFKNDTDFSCTYNCISRYRFLWLNLSELLQSLGNAYARTYSTYCLFMFINITITIYATLSKILDNGFSFTFKEVGLIVNTMYCCTLLYIFCNCSHNATLEVAKGVQNTLLSVDLSKVDLQTRREIDLFIVAIEMNPAVVSLKGYANVNNELLTSSITTIAIYLLVLIQFKLALKSGTITAANLLQYGYFINGSDINNNSSSNVINDIQL